MPCGGGGGTHRSWPTGEVDQVQKKGSGKGWLRARGGVQGLRFRGVGGRGTGPGTEQISQTCVETRTKVGWFPPELAWWPGG